MRRKNVKTWIFMQFTTVFSVACLLAGFIRLNSLIEFMKSMLNYGDQILVP